MTKTKSVSAFSETVQSRAVTVVGGRETIPVLIVIVTSNCLVLFTLGELLKSQKIPKQVLMLG